MAGTCKIQLTSNIPALKAAAQREAEALVERTAQQIVTDARLSMAAEPKTGRIYRYGSVEHQASAPGEPPAVDTGFLINSFWIWRPRPLTRIVEVGAEYAAKLEFGTERIAARPFLRPAFKKAEAAFRAALAGIIRRGAK